MIRFLIATVILTTVRGSTLLSLEKRVEALEEALLTLEPKLETRYGLTRHCEPPVVKYGKAHCSDVLKPGARCSMTCTTGYIHTPGKEQTYCQKGGIWGNSLECEIPLLIVSGGSIGNNDSSVETVPLHPGSGCDIKIPNMPLMHNTHRSLHNLLYVPETEPKLLACNGFHNKTGSVCDVLNLKKVGQGWTRHSTPYINTYAAQFLYIDRKPTILGGMKITGSLHKPINYIWQYYSDRGWEREKEMGKSRGFFCAVKTRETGLLATGGLIHTRSGNEVDKYVEYISLKRNHYGGVPYVPAMSSPRSGHGCTKIDNDGGYTTIMVSGGTSGFGEASVNTGEIYRFRTKKWTPTAPMGTARFGHALVAVGDKVFAIGGDIKDPHNVLDSIEEYDVKNNAWKSINKKLKMPRANFAFALVPHSLFKGCKMN